MGGEELQTMIDLKGFSSLPPFHPSSNPLRFTPSLDHQGHGLPVRYQHFCRQESQWSGVCIDMSSIMASFLFSRRISVFWLFFLWSFGLALEFRFLCWLLECFGNGISYRNQRHFHPRLMSLILLEKLKISETVGKGVTKVKEVSDAWIRNEK